MLSGVQRKWIAMSVSLLVVLLDQLSKYWALHNLSEGPLFILPGFRLALTFNPGIAFSLLTNQSPWILILGMGLMILILMISVWRIRAPSACLLLALACILGGAIGNLLDRLWQGVVIDFIDVFIGPYHWPTFNIADAAISLGVFLWIFQEFFSSKSQGKRSPSHAN